MLCHSTEAFSWDLFHMQTCQQLSCIDEVLFMTAHHMLEALFMTAHHTHEAPLLVQALVRLYNLFY
jgi:hypothetical protein